VRTPAPRPELQDADLFDQDGSDHATAPLPQTLA